MLYASFCSGGQDIAADLALAQKIVTPVEDIHQESVAVETAIAIGVVGPMMNTVTAVDIPQITEGVIIPDRLIIKNLTPKRSGEAVHHMLAKVQRGMITPAGSRV